MVFDLLVEAGFSRSEIRKIWQKEGSRGLREVTKNRLYQLQSMPDQRTMLQQVAAQNALGLLGDPTFVAAIDRGLPGRSEVPAAPPGWRVLRQSLHQGLLVRRPAGEGDATLTLHYSSEGQAKLHLSIQIETAPGPGWKGCLKAEGRTDRFPLKQDGTFTVWMPVRQASWRVPESDPTPCEPVETEMRPSSIQVGGKVDRRARNANVAVYWDATPQVLKMLPAQ